MNGRAEHLKRLVGELYELTNRGKLNWQRTSSAERFVVLLSSGSIEVSESEPWFDPQTGDEQYEYDARLVDRSGRLIDEFTSKDFADAVGKTVTLQELHRAARANAMKSDSVVQELLTELQTLGDGR